MKIETKSTKAEYKWPIFNSWFKKPDSLPGIYETNPRVLKPNIYSNIRSNDIIKNIKIQNLKTKYWSLWLAVSKKNFIDNANIINLEKPKTLDILFSKFKLKNKLIKNEIHKRNKATKNLFLKIVKFFSLKQNVIKIEQMSKVFKLINKLPIKKTYWK